MLRLPTFNIKNPHSTFPSLLSCIAKVYNSYQKEYYGSFLKTLLKDSYNAEEKWGTGKRMRIPFLKMHKGRAHRSKRARGGRI